MYVCTCGDNDNRESSQQDTSLITKVGTAKMTQPFNSTEGTAGQV